MLSHSIKNNIFYLLEANDLRCLNNQKKKLKKKKNVYLVTFGNMGNFCTYTVHYLNLAVYRHPIRLRVSNTCCY